MSWLKTNLMETEHLVIVFSGYNDHDSKRNQHDLEGILTSKTFSTVLVKDLDNSWYLGAIKGAGNNFEETASTLREIAGRYQKVLVLGESMGGFAALLYGCLIHATKIIATSPRTMVDPFLNHAIGDTNFLGHFRKMPDSYRKAFNLREIIRRSSPETRIEVYVSTTDRLAMHQASNIKMFPNVSVHTLEYFDHWILGHFKRYGALRKIIGAFLADIEVDILSYLEKLRILLCGLLTHEECHISQGQLIISGMVHRAFALEQFLDYRRLSFRVDVYDRTHCQPRLTSYLDYAPVRHQTEAYQRLVTIPCRSLPDEMLVVYVLLLDGQEVDNLHVPEKYFSLSLSAEQRAVGRPLQRIWNISDLYSSFVCGTWENEHVLYGPYMTLEKGDYLAEIVLRGWLEEGSSLTMDIAENHGRVKREKTFTFPSCPDSIEPFSVQLPFMAFEEISDFEVRLSVSGIFHGQIESVRLYIYDRPHRYFP